MHWVYIIKSKRHQQFYIGYTKNLVQRLKDHNAGLVTSTKRYLPWKLVYTEGYVNEDDARDRERKLKQFGKVYSQLKRRIWRSLRS